MATPHREDKPMTNFFQIDGFKIEIISVEPTTDLRFYAQRTLARMGTAGARAELARRAAIVASRNEA